LQRRFLNARSPLRLLEKNLHGGLGRGNLGIVLAGHGVGKTSFLVGVAVDELLRRGRVLHVSAAHSVAHVRTHYETLFDELASSTRLENEGLIRSEIERNRSIRVYPPNSITAARLRDAVKLEREAAGAPSLLVLEGVDLGAFGRADCEDLRALAQELDAEVWLESACRDERVVRIPPQVAAVEDLLSVILALEPDDHGVRLRALKDHENRDLANLHVALDPRTLLLKRS